MPGAIIPRPGATSLILRPSIYPPTADGSLTFYADATRTLLIGAVDGEEAGVLRYDFSGTRRAFRSTWIRRAGEKGSALCCS